MNSREDALFYDTSALLKDIDNLINNKQHFVISSFTIYNLEDNPTEENKSTLEKLIANKELWEDWFCDIKADNPKLTDLFGAYDYEEYVRPDETIFVTGSYGTYLIANRYFGDDSIKYIK